jgi:hypothetical protein
MQSRICSLCVDSTGLAADEDQEFKVIVRLNEAQNLPTSVLPPLHLEGNRYLSIRRVTCSRLDVPRRLSGEMAWSGKLPSSSMRLCR